MAKTLSKTRKIKCRNSKRLIPSRMTMNAAMKIKGVKSDAPKITMVMNTGKPMFLDGFSDRVIINMEGAKYQKPVTPIIGDHDTRLRIGHTTRQVVLAFGKRSGDLEGPLIYAEGTPSSSMAVSKGFVQDARNGFPFQTSVGADIVDSYYVDKGESVVVNGRRWRGPLIVADKTSIYELSVTVLGADRDTSATVAARRNSNFMEISNMTFAQWMKANGYTSLKLSAKQKAGLRAMFDQNKKLEAEAKRKTATATKTKVAASKTRNRRVSASRQTDDDDEFDTRLANRRNRLIQEEERIDGIKASFLRFSDDFEETDKVKFNGKVMAFKSFKQKALRDENITPDAVELTLLRAAMPGRIETPAIHVAQQVRDLPNEVISCALVRQSGHVKASETHKWTGEKWGYEEWYSEKVLEASDHKDLRNLSLHQLLDYQIIAAKGHGYHGNRKSDDFIEAAAEARQAIRAAGPTMLNISTIFEDSGNKIMWAAYQTVNTTWQEIVRIVNVSDFKTHNIYRLGSTGAYRLVGVDGELEHGGWTEDKYTHGADTYGKIVGLNRQHLINDDMNAFGAIMSALGMDSAKTKEELVWLLFMSSLTTLFPTDNSKKNYISGATTNLSIEGLTAMTQQWNNMVDADNSPISIGGAKLIVGTNNEIAARQLLNQTRIEIPPDFVGAQRQFADNPFAKMFPYVVSPYINNVAIKQRVSKLNAGAAIPNQTQTGWFMMADPNNPAGAALIVSLLNGNRLPVLQTAPAAFDTLGTLWRGYDDFGVDLGDYHFAAMSKGAA